MQISNVEENPDNTILIQGVKIYGKIGNIDILNVYISPLARTQYTNIRNIIPQLSHKTLIVGDFNAHNELWDLAGCTTVTGATNSSNSSRKQTIHCSMTGVTHMTVPHAQTQAN